MVRWEARGWAGDVGREGPGPGSAAGLVATRPGPPVGALCAGGGHVLGTDVPGSSR